MTYYDFFGKAYASNASTYYATNDYVMSLDYHNMAIYGEYGGYGNALDNVISGNGQKNLLDGGAGDDYLIGKGDRDTFVFDPGSGNDVIADFTTGASGDVVRLNGTSWTSFDQVRAHLAQSGSDVILTLDDQDAIKFLNTKVDSLTDSNFQLALDTSHLTRSFSEDFNSLSLWNGTTGTWRTDYGTGAPSGELKKHTLVTNGEAEIYVDPTFKGTSDKPLGLNPFSIDHGVLTITAAPTSEEDKQDLWNYDYTSGLLTTRNSFSQTYGYFEARMELPAGTGAWPAFWLLPSSGQWPPELDVMEAYGTGRTYETVHTGSGNSTQAALNFIPDATTGMHTYGVLWTATTLTWYIDGTAVFSQATPSDMHGPMYMLLNMAVKPSAGDDLTAQMQIDYVRAYTLGDSPVGGTAGDGPSDGRDPTGGSDTTAGVTVHHGTNGNDAYVISNPHDTIVEAANGGHDIVKASVSYTLPDNVEDLTLTGSTGLTGTGNALANAIVGTSGKDVLLGMAGNDVINGGAGDDRIVGGAGDDKLTGGAGADTFVLANGFGKDVITDFDLAKDHLDTSGLTSAAAKTIVLSDSSAGAIVSFGADRITLSGITIEQILHQAGSMVGLTASSVASAFAGGSVSETSAGTTVDALGYHVTFAHMTAHQLVAELLHG